MNNQDQDGEDTSYSNRGKSETSQTTEDPEGRR